MSILKVGDKAPDFVLKNQEGASVSLQHLISQKNIVLYFYPKNETPGCVKEACSFRDQYEDFLEAGAEVVGVSSDSVDSHQKFISNRNLPFILLSDPGGKVADAYGCKKSLFGLIPARVTFIIDQQGIIRNSFESQFNIDRHVKEALEVIKSLSRTPA